MKARSMFVKAIDSKNILHALLLSDWFLRLIHIPEPQCSPSLCDCQYISNSFMNLWNLGLIIGIEGNSLQGRLRI